MKRKLLALALAAGLCAGAAVPALGAESARGSNIRGQSYTTWASPVESYLYENAGGLTRVEHINSRVVVENYTADFALTSSWEIDMELPAFGGFYAGEEYNFLFFGQDNTEEDDGKEVIRVVQYDKDWNRLGSVGLFGANTVHPFVFGSLRCDEYGGYLYVRTCHEMYASYDGVNHQANVTFCVRESDMEITDAFYDIMNTDYGYVSHSFNQFILVDGEGNIVAADHGDAYPRGHALMRYPDKAGTDKFVPSRWGSSTTTVVDLVEFPGSVGQNGTGSSLGGLAETSGGYVAAYNWCSDGSFGGNGQRDVYLAFVPKDSFSTESVKTAKLTAAPGSSTPVLAPTGPEGGYVLWDDLKESSSYTVCYAPYGADGTVGQVSTVPGALSDCQPIPYGDGVVWYVTDWDKPVFYTLDGSGVTAHPAVSTPGPEETGTAYASTQSVLVDGETVTFECYALKNAAGNLTNYIKLRDLAAAVNGTAAQFEVGWDGSVTITTGAAYTANGSEGKTPYAGDRTYSENEADTKVDGKKAVLDAFVLKDDAGGGYTYYQLRDLGKILGFNVGWDGERGTIFVETDKEYDPAN